MSTSTSENLPPEVTVITVTYNAQACLEATIKSVISQKNVSLEYLIIDGNSTDETLKIVHRYKKNISLLVSEPDLGIYDAMNKGIRHANGQWLSFMNAGDTFFNDTSLANLLSLARNAPDAAIVYGGSHVLYPNGQSVYRPAGAASSLWKGAQFSHQAALIRRQFHAKNPYDLSLKIAADFAFFYRAQDQGAQFLRSNQAVVWYAAGGISDLNRLQAISELLTITRGSIRSFVYLKLRYLVEAVKIQIKKYLCC